MKILVIGGTSFFGKDIVNLALEQGHQVSIFSRGNILPDFWNRIEHIAGDRTDRHEFAKVLANKQFDVVIDNIAYNREQVTNALNVFQGRTGRYIFTSTIAVYIGRGTFDQPLREVDANFELSEDPQFESALKPMPPMMVKYAKDKIEAEQAIVEQNQIPYTIIRPPNVIGPEDNTGRVQFYFQRLIDGKPLILTNGGIQSFQPGYSKDLAHSYLLALDNPKAVNQVYTIAQTKTSQFIEWVELAAKCLGVRPNLVHIPADIIQKANFEYAEPWTHTGTHTFDISKAVTDLGFQPTPIESWTAKTAQWYKETKHKIDSPGYIDRAKEIEFAEKYIKKIAQLN